MTPALVVPGERTVVAVPGGNSALVQLSDQFVAYRSAAGLGVDRFVDRGQLLHRNRVEADPVAGRPDLVGEWREHLVLPLAVLALLLSVADPERGIVIRGEPERAVAKDAAEDQLHLVLADIEVLDGRKNFVPLLDLRRGLLALRRENHVVRRTGELPL